jgi:SAM-dependent methyltransferase
MKPSRISTKRPGKAIPSRARLAHIFSRLGYEWLPTGLRTAVVSRASRSWQFYCPVCEESVVQFSPLPDIYFRELEEHGSDLRIPDFETCNFAAYQCPHCGATDRDRLYALFMADRLPYADSARAVFNLLDIAPSRALSRCIKRKFHVRYRTADLMLKNVDDQVDITSMDCYPEGSFDAYICSHVLEHVKNDRKAMAELWRILKPGGWGIAMVPIHSGLKEIREDFTKVSPEERWKHFGQGDHVRVYSQDGFVARLQDAGFLIRRFGREHFGNEAMRRCGLSAASVLYVVEKPKPVTATPLNSEKCPEYVHV